MSAKSNLRSKESESIDKAMEKSKMKPPYEMWHEESDPDDVDYVGDDEGNGLCSCEKKRLEEDGEGQREEDSDDSDESDEEEEESDESDEEEEEIDENDERDEEDKANDGEKEASDGEKEPIEGEKEASDGEKEPSME